LPESFCKQQAAGVHCSVGRHLKRLSQLSTGLLLNRLYHNNLALEKKNMLIFI
jgi:hypothetical protein